MKFYFHNKELYDSVDWLVKATIDSLSMFRYPNVFNEDPEDFFKRKPRRIFMDFPAHLSAIEIHLVVGSRGD